jgi:hypothetical protein
LSVGFYPAWFLEELAILSLMLIVEPSEFAERVVDLRLREARMKTASSRPSSLRPRMAVRRWYSRSQATPATAMMSALAMPKIAG